MHNLIKINTFFSLLFYTILNDFIMHTIKIIIIIIMRYIFYHRQKMKMYTKNYINK